MFAKLGSSLKRFSGSGGYANGGQNLPSPAPASVEKTADTSGPRATFFVVPGFVAVQVAGEAMPRPISSLQKGEKILSIEASKDGALVWVLVNSIAAVQTPPKSQNQIVVGIGEDTMTLMAEQVVLARDRKRKVVPRQARRLEIGVDSLILYNVVDLRNMGRKAQEVKKISAIRLVRAQAVQLYQIEVGTMDQSVLLLDSPDAKYFFALTPPNTSVDQNAFEDRKPAVPLGTPVVKIQNTFINVQSETTKEPGMPRSFSDTDIRRLAIELDLEEAPCPPTGIFASDDMLSLSSGRSSALTSKSRASSYFAKSEVSSASAGSITEVRIGTARNMDEAGNEISISTDVVQLTDYSNLPVNEYGVRLPAASINHQPGRRSRCRKCAFYNTFSIKKGKTCKNGALCDFCHESHDRFIHRR